MRFSRLTLLAVGGVLCVLQPALMNSAEDKPAGHAFVFRDVGDETGLFPHLAGIRGHGAAWGDLEGTGWPDLFVASFHDNGSKAGMLFRNDKGKFRLDTQEHLRTSGAGSGVLFADLANNGRLDLFVSTCATNTNELRRTPSYLFRNDGQGKFTDISKESGILLPLYAGRGLAALDADGDGLLDLVTVERYYGPVKVGPVLFHNQGGHRFANLSKEAGLPEGFSSLAVAVADVNNDGWPDLFFTEGEGNHRLYLNNGKGKFVEAPGSRENLLQQFNRHQRSLESGPALDDLTRLQERAYTLLTSNKLKAAFDMSTVADQLRDRYDRTLFGASAIIGRRLVEAGVRFVNVTWDFPGDNSWDTHADNFGWLRGALPSLDATYSALMEDLEDRGLLDETLVVVMSDMGRTPQVNGSAGRDHWTFCYTVVFAGAGIRGGMVHGASDANAAYVKERPVSTSDICATIYECLGIDPDMPIQDRGGRPMPVAHGGKPIQEILA